MSEKEKESIKATIDPSHEDEDRPNAYKKVQLLNKEIRD